MAEATTNDPFYMTFGREKWNELTNTNKKTPNKQMPSKKTSRMVFEDSSNIERPRKSSQSQIKKARTLNIVCKENIDCNQRTLHRTKAMSSLTDRQPKQLLDITTIRQEMQKKYSNDKSIKSQRKRSAMFDNQLDKRLKEIETAAKAKIFKIASKKETRAIEAYYEPEIVLDKYKLINTQAARRARIITVNPTVNRYREEMIKLDSLIQRVNAKLGSSTPKNNTDLIQRHTLEKE